MNSCEEYVLGILNKISAPEHYSAFALALARRIDWKTIPDNEIAPLFYAALNEKFGGYGHIIELADFYK